MGEKRSERRSDYSKCEWAARVVHFGATLYHQWRKTSGIGNKENPACSHSLIQSDFCDFSTTAVHLFISYDSSYSFTQQKIGFEEKCLMFLRKGKSRVCFPRESLFSYFFGICFVINGRHIS